MSASAEDILLLAAQQQAQQQLSVPQAAGVGAAAGGLLGLYGGNQVHQVGNQINEIKDKLAAREGMTRKGLPIGKRLPRTGARATGGLIGLIAGGALGAGVQQAFVQNNPAAAALAKIQTQSSLNPTEIAAIQSVLGDAYNQTLAM